MDQANEVSPFLILLFRSILSNSSGTKHQRFIGSFKLLVQQKIYTEVDYYAGLHINRANRLKTRSHHPLKSRYFIKKVPSDSAHDRIRHQ